MIKLTIYFKYSRGKQTYYCDYYKVINGLLVYTVRFGEDCGTHCIPYDSINKFTVCK